MELSLMPASQHFNASAEHAAVVFGASVMVCVGAAQETAAARVAATAAAAALHDPPPKGYELDSGLLWEASPPPLLMR